MNFLRRNTGLIFDLFFAIVFMPLLIAVGPVHSWWHSLPLFTVVVIVYLYAVYFTTGYLRLPKLIINKQYYRLAAILITALVTTYLVTLFPLPDMDFVIPSMSEYQTRVRNYNIAISVWFMFSVVISYALSVAFVKELYERMLQQALAEKARNEAQLAVFKAQISPHFLFNTLNSLYSLVIGTSQKAEDAFIKFTEIMKYTYVTIENEFVAVSDEIHYIRNYIDLQMIRLDGHTRVMADFDVDDDDTLIPPMLFLTFVENAFKYGASSTTDCVIHINMKISDRMLDFRTENGIIRHKSEFESAMSVGLANCRNRLEVLFPDNYELLTDEKQSRFEVILKINLNSYGK